MIIIVLLVTLFLKILSAFFNAVMDAVDHYGAYTIFIRDDSTGHYKKIFGISWNFWFNLDRGWLNKYEDRNSAKPLRKFKILFWKFESTVFSDCWHFAKMLMKGTDIINHCFLIASASIIVLVSDSALIVVPSMFILYALFDIIPFNNFYKKYLIKKKYRVLIK